MVSFNYHTETTPCNLNTASATGLSYNAGLKQRGSLTFWIDEVVLEAWLIEDLSGKPRASRLDSDLAIATMATLKAVYRLAGRQCQGFVESIFELMEIDLPVPDHSTLARRFGQSDTPSKAGGLMSVSAPRADVLAEGCLFGLKLTALVSRFLRSDVSSYSC